MDLNARTWDIRYGETRDRRRTVTRTKTERAKRMILGLMMLSILKKP